MAVDAAIPETYYETARFCLLRVSSTEPRSFSKFTFVELAKQGITSEQLYFWSAPFDLIERYQLSLDNKDLSYYSSFDKSIISYYVNMFNDPFILTCYTHLKCNIGSPLLCLDWRDCIDDGSDEDLEGEFDVNSNKKGSK